jgi:glucose/arabinose dehydrogenase/sugar lactone lactonase YvrE
MKRLLPLALLYALAPAAAGAEPPKPMVTGLKNPESVCVGPGPDRKVFVTAIGEFDKDGDGAVMVVEPGGKAVPFVSGLDDPKGIALYQRWLFVTDKTRVLRIDATAKTPKAEVFAAADKFPTPPIFLNDVAVDPETGAVFVSDSGKDGRGGAVYRIAARPRPKGKGSAKDAPPEVTVSVVVDEKKLPGLKTPNGLMNDGTSFLLVADFGTGFLHRVRLADGTSERIAEGFDGADGVTWDFHGRLYVSSWKTGKVFVIAKPGEKPVLAVEGFKSAADTCLDPSGKSILVPDMLAGTLTAIPAQVPGAEVDVTPMPLKTELAFADLKWTGWSPETADGKSNALRPIVLTHAGDGSNRIFVATQHGVLHVFPNDPKATATKVVLDIQDRVQYDDRTNEEGLLGVAFHPKFKENGEVFVFYTPKRRSPKEEMANVVSRFRASKADPSVFDPASEEQILRYSKRPFWNHDGGTIVFGPDGFLYVVHGDGGSANDPFDNGQNLKSWFGKILRIDVNAKADGKNYAIPPDNPFVGRADALPEIYAYGLRNPWRIAFDRKTGKLWCGEVGQNLYEEINIIERGGNYGWRRRESYHPFAPNGRGPSKEFVEPIWEYHHDVGKSITGGTVYRGAVLPELQGHYVYADYVSSRIWALRYDESAQRVTANRPIPDPNKPVLSFGEDEKGELYFLVVAPNGRGIYRFVK